MVPRHGKMSSTHAPTFKSLAESLITVESNTTLSYYYNM